VTGSTSATASMFCISDMQALSFLFGMSSDICTRAKAVQHIAIQVIGHAACREALRVVSVTMLLQVHVHENTMLVLTIERYIQSPVTRGLPILSADTIVCVHSHTMCASTL
jgi:hypothetical protein